MDVGPPRERFFWLWIASCAVVLCSPLRVAAQPQAVGVLRATSSTVPAEIANGVDQALLSNLAELVNIQHPLVSPAAYDEIQLTVGCEGESRECLSSIAQTLQVEAIVVSRLNADESGLATLELIYFQTGSDREPAHVQVAVPLASRSEITAQVPGLVRRLFGLPEPAPAAERVAPPPQPEPSQHVVSAPTLTEPASAPSPARADRSGVAPLTWVTLIAGAGVLGAGAVVRLNAQSSFDDLKKTPVRTEADAERLHRDFDSIQTRGTVATILMPVGGAVLGLGAVLLVLDLSNGNEPSDRDTARLNLTPLRGGMAVTFSSAFEGG